MFTIQERLLLIAEFLGVDQDQLRAAIAAGPHEPLPDRPPTGSAIQKWFDGSTAEIRGNNAAYITASLNDAFASEAQKKIKENWFQLPPPKLLTELSLPIHAVIGCLQPENRELVEWAVAQTPMTKLIELSHSNIKDNISGKYQVYRKRSDFSGVVREPVSIWMDTQGMFQCTWVNIDARDKEYTGLVLLRERFLYLIFFDPSSSIYQRDIYTFVIQRSNSSSNCGMMCGPAKVDSSDPSARRFVFERQTEEFKEKISQDSFDLNEVEELSPTSVQSILYYEAVENSSPTTGAYDFVLLSTRQHLEEKLNAGRANRRIFEFSSAAQETREVLGDDLSRQFAGIEHLECRDVMKLLRSAYRKMSD